MSLYTPLRAILFDRSRSDAEIAHMEAIRLLQFVQRHELFMRFLEQYQSIGVGMEKPVVMCGMHFRNRVGISAGFDKHFEVARGLEQLGFGHIEGGTFTPRAQQGNERPRVFRLWGGRGAINRYGFNSYGARAGRKNFEENIPSSATRIGISLGKNKDTPNERAGEDYEHVVEEFAPHGDYLALNVSSPNTPGIRDLQMLGLRELVEGVKRRDALCRQALNKSPRPILVKVAPDLSDDQLDLVIDEGMEGGAAGFIAGNTTLKWPQWVRDKYGDNRHLFDESGKQQPGGYSGVGTFGRTLGMLKQISNRAPKAGLIAVGGIQAPIEARAAIEDGGATLVQIYTGLVLHGPPLVRAIRRELARI